MGDEMIKLPRFKIYYNTSEDYYFIKERVFLFWYTYEKRLRSRNVFMFNNLELCESLKLRPNFEQRYTTLEEAENKIKLILAYENPCIMTKTPDEIKLVKEL